MIRSPHVRIPFLAKLFGCRGRYDDGQMAIHYIYWRKKTYVVGVTTHPPQTKTTPVHGWAGEHYFKR